MPVQPAWQVRDVSGVRFHELRASGARLVFTTRQGGVSLEPYASLNLHHGTGDDPAAVDENWLRLRRALVIEQVVTMKQVHSDTVLPVPAETAGGELPRADACYTWADGPALGIRVADCLPVYVLARDGTGRGIAHCGWRGTVARIAEKLCRAMAGRFGLPLSAFRFSLGPSVCARCYTVHDDVRAAALRSLPDANRLLTPVADSDPPAWRFDLRGANRRLLLGLGLTELPALDLCSYEDSADCYSARRDRVTGRNLALIARA